MPDEELNKLVTPLRDIMLILRDPSKSKKNWKRIEQIFANSSFKFYGPEVAAVLNAFTNYKFELSESEEGKPMVDVRGMMDNIKAEGRAEEKDEMIRSFLMQGVSLEIIAKASKKPLKYIRTLQQSLSL